MAVENTNTTQKMVTIKIPLTRNEKDDVFVAVNGKKYLIKRGCEVKVPEAVAKVIKRSEKSLEAAMAYEQKAQQNMP
jgi:hypothetical protein